MQGVTKVTPFLCGHFGLLPGIAGNGVAEPSPHTESFSRQRREVAKIDPAQLLKLYLPLSRQRRERV